MILPSNTLNEAICTNSFLSQLYTTKRILQIEKHIISERDDVRAVLCMHGNFSIKLSSFCYDYHKGAL